MFKASPTFLMNFPLSFLFKKGCAQQQQQQKHPQTSLKSGCELEDLPIGKPSRLGSKAQRGGAQETND